jgi:XapX domain-containing protein
METRDCSPHWFSVASWVKREVREWPWPRPLLLFGKPSEEISVKLLIGLVVSFVVGFGCRYFDIPVPSPPVIPGALLVLAMTIGYSSANVILDRKGKLATTAHLCGGPTGSPVTGKVGPSSPPIDEWSKHNSGIVPGVGRFELRQRS